MKCIKCGKEMIVDDVDYNFKGNYDIYWLCNDCECGAIESVRYGKTCKIHFGESNGKDTKLTGYKMEGYVTDEKRKIKIINGIWNR